MGHRRTPKVLLGMSDTPAAEFTVQETSEEPVLASVDYDEDDAAGGDDLGGDDLAAELEELQKIVSDTQAKTDALVAATKSAVSEGLAQTVGGPDDDARSVFVSDVDFSVTGEELAKHFQSCGQVAKVTLLKDKITLRPKGCVLFVVACGMLNSCLDRRGRKYLLFAWGWRMYGYWLL